jgi:hypothetical protein
VAACEAYHLPILSETVRPARLAILIIGLPRCHRLRAAALNWAVLRWPRRSKAARERLGMPHFSDAACVARRDSGDPHWLHRVQR